MIRIRSFFIVAAVACLLIAAKSKTVDTSYIDMIQKRYDRLKTVSAVFKQEIFSTRFGGKPSEGRVFFHFPGKMRWEYAKPNKKVLASNGEKSWLYDEIDKQILVGNATLDQTAMGFLWGRQKIVEVFDQLRVERRQHLVELEMAPKKKMAGVEKIRIVYDTKVQIIVKVTIYDPSGNRNTIEFQDIDVDKNLKANLFEFEVPKGVHVINTSQATSANP